jgi:CheY-like chemotaxis protein
VDGAESVAKAASERPDLVLMDIRLPVVDGYDATRQIKALPGLAAIPIIAVSSFAMKRDEEKARAAGCDHYVTKPYSPVHSAARHPRLPRRYFVTIIGSAFWVCLYGGHPVKLLFWGFFLSFPPILLFGLENAHSFVPALTAAPARARKIGQ